MPEGSVVTVRTGGNRDLNVISTGESGEVAAETTDPEMPAMMTDDAAEVPAMDSEVPALPEAEGAQDDVPTGDEEAEAGR